MSFRFQFDPTGRPVVPTLILASHSGRQKLGSFVAPYGIRCTDAMVEPCTFDFTIDKSNEPLWDKVVDFKTVYVMEWDTWLQIQVTLTDGNSTQKSISGRSLCESELSQILIHEHEYNTDDDIARDDYLRAVIYTDDTDNYNSILTDLFSKAPHYTIEHVDPSIASMQKTFTFNDTSIQDALQEIAQECHAVIVYNDGMNPETNLPARGVSLYDLESLCNNCGHRGEFLLECPECGSTDIRPGYREDTSIFITKENLTQEVQLTTNIDSIKNCFKLVAGDDVMTTAIQSCNPNGTDYIWYFSDEMKSDMSEELRNKIDQYDEEYKYYQLEYPLPLDDDVINNYNTLLVDKYIGQKDDLQYIDKSKLIGYPALMSEMFNIIDFELFIESALMPTGKEATGTNAHIEAGRLTHETLSPVAITSRYNITPSLIDTMVLGLATLSVDKRYSVKIKTSQLRDINNENKTAKWIGGFTVTNNSDPDDTADTDDNIIININEDYQRYIKQRVSKVINAESDKRNFDATELLNYETSLDDFKNAIKYYNIATLMTIKDACDTVLDTILGENYNQKDNESRQFYSNYYNKAAALIAEIKAKEDEKAIIIAVKDAFTDIREDIQTHLNFEAYLGEDLFNEFCTYRRENVYKNDHYISDGLTNEELFQNAREFFNTAEKEIYKSATAQHSINSTLKNLLAIPQFEPLREHFELGNWLRILIDGEIYKLRLIRYSINFDEIENLVVEFSDVLKGTHGFYDVENLLKQMSSMATSYDTVARQATKGDDAAERVSDWFTNGLDATLTRIVDDSGNQDVLIDNHGIQIRDYDPVLDDYKPTQMKFINSILAITDDNWEHIRTAVGNFIYQDPTTLDYKEAYGINAETVVGSLILGQNLRIHNGNDERDSNLIFDEDGLLVYNDVNRVKIDPNSNNLVYITHDDEPMLWLDDKGMLHITGDGAGLDISANNSITGLETNFQVVAGEIRSEITNTQTGLTSYIDQTADAINTKVGNIQSGLQSSIEQTQSSITAMVQDNVNGLSSRIDQNTNAISLAVESQNNMRAEFLVSLDGIRSYFEDTANNIRSSLTQTADQIRTEITQGDNALKSSINQTADQIRSEVIEKNSGLQSLISQTATEIRQEVSNSNGAIQSSIVQQASQIQALVKQGDNLYSIIQETADQIRTEVVDKTERLQSSITQNAGLISLLVSGGDETSELKLTPGAISVIATSTVNLIAKDINAKGLLTIESIGGSEAIMDVVNGNFTDYHSVFYSKTAPNDDDPEHPLSDGDTWYEYADETVDIGPDENGQPQYRTERHIMGMYRYTNSEWVEYRAGTTVIGNGVITTDLLSANAITAEKFAGNQLTSLNYEHKVGDHFTDSGVLMDFSNGQIYGSNYYLDQNGSLISKNVIGISLADDGTTSAGIFLSNPSKSNNAVFSYTANGSAITNLYILNTGEIKSSCGADFNGVSIGGKIGEADDLGKMWINKMIDGQSTCNISNMASINANEYKYNGTSIIYTESNLSKLEINKASIGTINNVWFHGCGIHVENNGTDQAFIMIGDTPVALQDTTSDKELKYDWQPFDSRYDEAYMELEPVTFMYKNFKPQDHHDRRHYGFLAQDAERVFNNHNISNEEMGFLHIRQLQKPNDVNNMIEYAIRYEELIALNTHMIQKTIRENEELKSKIARLESQIDYLMNKQ